MLVKLAEDHVSMPVGGRLEGLRQTRYYSSTVTRELEVASVAVYQLDELVMFSSSQISAAVSSQLIISL